MKQKQSGHSVKKSAEVRLRKLNPPRQNKGTPKKIKKTKAKGAVTVPKHKSPWPKILKVGVQILGGFAARWLRSRHDG